MSNIKNWNDLINNINKKTENVLNKEVFEEVRDTIQKHIETDVYSTYTPKVYERRGNSDGLIADDNIVGSTKNTTTLIVKDIAKPNNSIVNTSYNPDNETKFSEWIEYGQVLNGNAKYLFPSNVSNDAWTKPRPFIENTIEDLKQNKQHLKALRKGLKSKGFKIT